ncbi:MAG: hypothetical protein NTW95_04885, partial [Candidatus Aminicenantes bacterium]|nr:hypothetical protein [Candidatus Aminicenantes bacterium]
ESVVIMVSSARFKQIIDMNEALAMKLTAVITRRQDELKLFSEKNLAVDAGAAIAILRNSLYNHFIGKPGFPDFVFFKEGS